MIDNNKYINVEEERILLCLMCTAHTKPIPKEKHKIDKSKYLIYLNRRFSLVAPPFLPQLSGILHTHHTEEASSHSRAACLLRILLAGTHTRDVNNKFRVHSSKIAFNFKHVFRSIVFTLNKIDFTNSFLLHFLRNVMCVCVCGASQKYMCIEEGVPEEEEEVLWDGVLRVHKQVPWNTFFLNVCYASSSCGFYEDV